MYRIINYLYQKNDATVVTHFFMDLPPWGTAYLLLSAEVAVVEDYLMTILKVYDIELYKNYYILNIRRLN